MLLPLVNRSSGGGYNPQYITTGLSIYESRCMINDGGYYIDPNNIVHVDITVTLRINVGANLGVVIGFPQCSATASGWITGAFNDLIMGYDLSENRTYLGMAAGHTAGETLHFIGSYQMKTN